MVFSRWIYRAQAACSKSFFLFVVFIITVIVFFLLPSRDQPPFISETVKDSQGHVMNIDSNHPFIFIGGLPRSGTTLMRAMLDVNSQIRCGTETRVIPAFLKIRRRMVTNEKEKNRLRAAGVLGDPLDSALAAFMVKLLTLHGPVKPRLCAKDPYLIIDALFILRMLPNSKFIFMIRDGRAFIHSMLKRKVTIGEFNNKAPLQALAVWNRQMTTAYKECMAAGASRCFAVRYEDLIRDPVLWLGRITSFLGVPLEPKMYEPWKFIGKDVIVSDTEKSTDQISKPIYLSSIDEWVRQMPKNFTQAAIQFAPMLEKLGYDVVNDPPKYGEPNPQVWINGEFHPPS